MTSCFLLSAERFLSGGGEHPGRSDSTQPQRLLPSHDARRLRAAGGQRVVGNRHTEHQHQR